MKTIDKNEMPDFLNTILNRKKEMISEQKKVISPYQMRRLAESSVLPITFTARFQKGQTNIIAELKKASPSKGMIRKDLDCARLATVFEEKGAVALSVLTEERSFFGSPENIQAASQNSTLPILRKDFIFDEYQIDEARYLGASAILLIAAMLPTERLCALTVYAQMIGLSVLGEAHCREEIEILLDTPVNLIGVNARDLRTFQTSLAKTQELLPMIPADRFPVAESAIRSSDDISALKKVGAAAFLIGETLMRSANPGLKLQELLR